MPKTTRKIKMRNLEIEKLTPNLNSIIGSSSYEINNLLDYKKCDDDFFDELIIIKSYLYQLTDDEKLEIYKELVDFDDMGLRGQQLAIGFIERTEEAIDEYLKWAREYKKQK